MADDIKSRVNFTRAMSVPPVERFHLKTEKMCDNGCWVWHGTVNMKGSSGAPYGHFFDGEKMIAAHRYSYQLYKGPLARKDHLHHTCKNTLCVNPAHLVITSAADHVKTFHPAKPKPPKLGHRSLLEKGVCRHGHIVTVENVYGFAGSFRCSQCIRDKRRANLALRVKEPRIKALRVQVPRVKVTTEIEAAATMLTSTFSMREINKIFRMTKQLSAQEN